MRFVHLVGIRGGEMESIMLTLNVAELRVYGHASMERLHDVWFVVRLVDGTSFRPGIFIASDLFAIAPQKSCVPPS